jgi:phosphatidylglycerophosphatase A
MSCMKRGGLAFSTVFGLGFLRPAPGTWGSLPPVALAGVLLAVGLRPETADGPAHWTLGPWLAYHAVLVGVFIVFSLVCAAQGDWAEARFGHKDPGSVVADETAGQCLPLLFIPAPALASPGLAVFTLIFAFVSFRVLDILKPPPARELQRVPGGWGIVLDDWIAGLYALLAVQFTARLVL